MVCPDFIKYNATFELLTSLQCLSLMQYELDMACVINNKYLPITKISSHARNIVSPPFS